MVTPIRRGGRDDRPDKKRSYFERPDDKEDQDRNEDKERKESTQQFIKGLSKHYAEVGDSLYDSLADNTSLLLGYLHKY